MDKRTAEGCIGSLVRFWHPFDGEYVAELQEVGGSWRAKARIVSVLRVSNGPDGWRMPLAEGHVAEVSLRDVRPWDGGPTVWQPSALAAARAEADKRRAKGVEWDKPFAEQLDKIIAHLESGGPGRVPEPRDGKRRKVEA